MSEAEPRPLACGFNGSLIRPSDRVKKLASDITAFQTTFRELETILKEGKTTVERIDEFRQTLDECDDFLFDYQNLQDGKSFDKRPALLPDIQYRMPRYVYTDSEIAALESRIEIQLKIMHAKINYAKGLNDDQLKLQSLLASFSKEPPFLTRKRIYMGTPSSSLPQPSIPLHEV
ncbi:hypothetical protein GP486_005608 [Trichoglossum hirsutum]|uniref:Uncharacterized protein n=1 Tax=Trichoglossum hirsutum TaxID=265104 RepID=A0A9P8L8Y3_9PEZI|nr:hypothetical protein GP486_005608 [Trichoglossum hirsutum]